MESMTVEYIGELRTSGVHLRSGKQVITDAPTDNNGKGEAFSPTDLLCSALVSCMFTLMGILARRKVYNIDGASATIEKIMAENPRRVVEIRVKMKIPDRSLPEEGKKMLEQAARTCPVAQSLNPEIKQILELEYYEA